MHPHLVFFLFRPLSLQCKLKDKIHSISVELPMGGGELIGWCGTPKGGGADRFQSETGNRVHCV